MSASRRLLSIGLRIQDHVEEISVRFHTLLHLTDGLGSSALQTSSLPISEDATGLCFVFGAIALLSANFSESASNIEMDVKIYQKPEILTTS